MSLFKDTLLTVVVNCTKGGVNITSITVDERSFLNIISELRIMNPFRDFNYDADTIQFYAPHGLLVLKKEKKNKKKKKK